MREGYIKKVFFATDELDLKKDAEHFIDDPNALVTIHNVGRDSLSEYAKDSHDSFSMRNNEGMHAAILEWYILGEADYCMSPTDELSTFSKVKKNLLLYYIL
jgi:hypothetical protein